MTYGFVQDVPANEQIYREIKAKLGEAPPKGLIAHIAFEHGPGLRYVDVWETEADWDRFREECVEPTVDEVLAGYGIPHDHSVVTIDAVKVVDAWLGAPATA